METRLRNEDEKLSTEPGQLQGLMPSSQSLICTISSASATAVVPAHWDEFVQLTASVYSGHTSAVNALARFGCAARGEPLYEIGVVIGRLLRTIFLADYFVNPAFRRELLRVLNCGEATNALKRLIYTGRVANY
jgi:TnpA family transposase